MGLHRMASFLLHNCDRNCNVSIHFSGTPAQKIPRKSIQELVSVTCGQTGNVRKRFTVNARYKVPEMSAEQGLRFSCLNPYLPVSEGRYYMCGRNSTVGTATRYELVSRQGREYPHSSRPAPRPTRPPIQFVPGVSRGKTALAWCYLLSTGWYSGCSHACISPRRLHKHIMG